jgi:hypothetical protein
VTPCLDSAPARRTVYRGMRLLSPRLLSSASVAALLVGAALLMTGLDRAGVSEHPASPVTAKVVGAAVLRGAGELELPLHGTGTVALPVLRPGVYTIDQGWPHPLVGSLLPPRVLHIADGPGDAPATVPLVLLGLWGIVTAATWWTVRAGRALLVVAGGVTAAGAAWAVWPGPHNLTQRAALLLLCIGFASSALNTTRPISTRVVLCAAAVAVASGIFGVVVPVPLAGACIILAASAATGRRAAVIAASAVTAAALGFSGHHPGVTVTGGGGLTHLGACFAPERPEPEMLRCAQTVVTLAGIDGGYRQDAQALLELSQSDLARGAIGGRLCRLGGNALAEANVIGGQDPAFLLNTEVSVCDFSLPHGVASAVAFWARTPEQSIAELCEPVERGPLGAYTVGTQCWHGAGQGIIRRTAFDFAAVAEFCRAAPDRGFTQNCMEGALIEGLDAAAWSEGLPDYQHPGTQITLETCVKTFPDEYLSPCYRYGADAVIRTSGELAAVETIAAMCADPAVRGPLDCWQAFGDVLARWQAVHPDIVAIDTVISRCQQANEQIHRQVCVLRLVNTLLAKPGQSEIDKLLIHVPAEHIDTVRPAVEQFAETIRGLRGAPSRCQACPAGVDQ